MNQIITKEFLSENVVKLVVESPKIAKKRKAGHFVMVRATHPGERIPLTIADADPIAGTITLIIQRIGSSTFKLTDLNVGDPIHDILGPLGQATHIEKFGNVLCVGGGVGAAPLYPIVKELFAAGNKVFTVLGGRTKELVILEKEMRVCSYDVKVMTDDGSYGTKGLVTHGMEEIIAANPIDMAVVIGPGIMMKFAAEVTRKHNIPTMASLNSIMVDGTGMCGGCRVTVGGEVKFVCVDGPEFDAHKIDFEEVLLRQNQFKTKEKASQDHYCQTGKI